MHGGSKISKRYLLAAASSIAMLSAGATGANATSPEELEAAVKAMQAQIAVLQKQVEELTKSRKE